MFSVLELQFSPKNSSFNTISEEVSFETRIDPILAASAETKKIVEIDLKPVINTDNPLDTNTAYKTKKKEIVDLYRAGNRDEQTIQLYLYFASVEGDKSSYESIVRDWCVKSPEACTLVRMPVVSRGKITDSLGRPIEGAKIFFFGDELNSVTSNNIGYYTLTTTTLHPKRMRLIVQHPQFAG